MIDRARRNRIKIKSVRHHVFAPSSFWESFFIFISHFLKNASRISESRISDDSQRTLFLSDNPQFIHRTVPIDNLGFPSLDNLENMCNLVYMRVFWEVKMIKSHSGVYFLVHLAWMESEAWPYVQAESSSTWTFALSGVIQLASSWDTADSRCECVFKNMAI